MPTSQTNARHDEAAEWFVALQSNLSPTQIQDWDLWIADPHNRASFDAMCALWGRSKAIRPQPLPTAQAIAADDYDGSKPFVEWSALRSSNPLTTPEDSGAARVDAGNNQRSVPRFGWRVFALAAALVATVGIAWMFYEQSAFEPQLYETSIAQHRTVNLPDGSEVMLGAQTAVWVTYTRQRRTVVLDRGEVLIHVAPQRTRPFAVLAGNGVVTAVGTRFAVKRSSATDRVTVTVTEGVVRVEPQSSQLSDTPSPTDIAQPSVPPEPRPVIATLNKGRQVSYDGRGSLTAVKPVDSQSAVAWREGRLLYRDESLREVIADVNRYSHRKIVFADDSADALRYTGTVFQGDVDDWKIDDWIDGLDGIFDLEIVEADAEHVVLRKRHAE